MIDTLGYDSHLCVNEFYLISEKDESFILLLQYLRKLNFIRPKL